MVCWLWWPQSGWSVGAVRRCEKRQHIGKSASVGYSAYQRLVLEYLRLYKFTATLEQASWFEFHCWRLFSAESTASSAAKASHLWSLSALQLAPTSRCRNARPASSCWANYPRAKGKCCNKHYIPHLFITLKKSGLSTYNVSHTAAWTSRWGDIWGGRGGRNGRGAYVYSWLFLCIGSIDSSLSPVSM